MQHSGFSVVKSHRVVWSKEGYPTDGYALMLVCWVHTALWVEPGTPPSLITHPTPKPRFFKKKNVLNLCVLWYIPVEVTEQLVRVNSLLLPCLAIRCLYQVNWLCWPTSSKLKYVSTNSRVKHTQEPQSKRVLKHTGLLSFFPAHEV